MRTVLVAVLLLATLAVSQTIKSCIVTDYEMRRTDGTMQPLPFGSIQVLTNPDNVQIQVTVCPKRSNPNVQEACITGFGVDGSIVMYNPVTDTITYSENDHVVPHFTKTRLMIFHLRPTGGHLVVFNSGHIVFTPQGTTMFIFDDITKLDGSCVTNNTMTVMPPGNSFFDDAPYESSTPFTARAQLFPMVNYIPKLPVTLSAAAVSYCNSLGFTKDNVVLFQFCGAAYDNYGQTKAAFTKQVQYWSCLQYCMNPYADTVMDELACDSQLCDWPMERMSKAKSQAFAPEVHYEEGKLLPPISMVRTGNGFKNVFHAPMGGVYTFNVYTQDECSRSPSRNVTVAVNCKPGFSANAGQDVTIEIDEFGPPLVQLSGTVGGDLFKNSLHVSWDVIKAPSMSSGNNMILYPHTLNPIFSLDAAGTWTMEMTAFDGCSLTRSSVNVHVKCINFTWEHARNNMDWNGRTMTWDHQNAEFTTFEMDIYPTCKNLNPVSNWMPDWKSVEHITRVDPLQDPLQFKFIDNGNKDQLTYKITAQLENKVGVANTTTTTTAMACYKTKSINVTSPYARTIEVAKNVALDECLSDTRVVTTVKQYVDKASWDECTITLNSDFDSSREVDVEKITAVPNYNAISRDDVADSFNTSTIKALADRFYPWGFGSCVGNYMLTVSEITHPFSCVNATKQLPFQIQCDRPFRTPLANTLSPCFDIKYDYPNTEFPQITLNGEDARQDSLNNMYYAWSSASKPINSGLASFVDYSTSRTLSLDVAGTYTFLYSVTDYCAVTRELLTVKATCTEPLTWLPAPKTTDGVESKTFDSATMSNNYFSLYANATSRYAVAIHWVAYSVRLKTSFDLGYGATKSFSFTTDGKWIMMVTATDGCTTIANNLTLTVGGCSAPNAMYTLTKTVLIYNNTYGWDSTGITDTSANPQLGTRNFFFDGVLQSGFPAGWTPQSVGDHVATLQVISPCLYSSVLNNQTVTVKCNTNVLTPFIQVNITEPYWEQVSGKTIAVIGDYSNAGAVNKAKFSVTSFFWTITNPGGKIVTAITSSTSFVPTVCGVYNITLTISDGCQFKSDSVLYTVKCRNSLTATATTNSSTALWSGKKFPIVGLFATNVFIDTLTSYSQATPTWTVLSAPVGSVFYGREYSNITTVVVQNTKSYTEVLFDGKFRYLQTNTTVYETITKRLTKYSILQNDQARKTTYGACFRPDVAGTYWVELRLQGKCPQDVSVSKVAVVATCPAAPTIGATVYSVFPNGTTSGTSHVVGNRVVFDATTTSTQSGLPLSYYWALRECDTLNNTDLKTNELVNVKSTKASWIPTTSGAHCVKLTVSDGCNTVTKDLTFNVDCPRHPRVAPTPRGTYTFDGHGHQAVVLDMDEETHLPKNMPFLYVYNWKLVKFSPTRN